MATVYAIDRVTVTGRVRSTVRRRFLDVCGQLTRVEEVNGAQTYTTTYAYDADVQLTQVTNHGGHLRALACDLLGPKTG